MKKLALIATSVFVFFMTLNVNAQDIVDVAAGNEDFSTLVTAVKAADLVGALKGEGPITVFAPTNAAFAKIDASTLTTLLKPENKATLASILTYHVVAGKYTAADVVKALKDNGGTLELTALSGAKFMVTQGKDGIYLKDANGGMSKIAATDVMATNGVIHVIESVIMPK
ncbi:MAG: putative surface protein with fasciclin (FAS1) repeats [Nonlabens sp.]|jgi:uncharacterized surface protein with fasciclin (FAS1) repeats